MAGPVAGSAIAAKIEAEKWGPLFNRLGKRFRLGISSFGRARLIRKRDASRNRYLGIGVFVRDLEPLDVAANPVFHILREVVQDAGKTDLGRRAAELAIRYVRMINTGRFGREEEIRMADIELSKWLRQ